MTRHSVHTTPPPAPEEETLADFGYKRVPRTEKSTLVGEVFDRVAGKYDLMNDLMSMGLHRLWKEALLDTITPRPDMQLLDVAGGTGDIARRFLARAPQSHVTVCDINPAMITAGRASAIDRNIITGIEWIVGNAESLPFPDRHFDACTIAFGIRNVTDIPKALTEMRRVLKPGGRFACLEFSRVTRPLLEKLYHEYSFRLVPWIGKQIVGDGTPYQYLVESIRKFPSQEQFAAMLKTTGFDRVQIRNMNGGIVAIHSAWRL